MKVNLELPDKITPEQSGRYLSDPNFCVQEKRNGKHRLMLRNGGTTECYNREGEQRNVTTALRSALMCAELPPVFAIDVEAEKNSIYILDLLILGDNLKLAMEPYRKRIQLADTLFSNRHPLIQVVRSFYGSSKLTAIQQFHNERAEGIVFKDLNASYREGRSAQHHALKFWKTLDAVVIDMKADGKDSVELGLFNTKGQLIRIGGSSMLGKGQLSLGHVVEVKYLYATDTYHIVQPTILRRRDDKAAKECTLSQLVFNRDMVPDGR